MNHHYNTISSGTQEMFWGGNPGRARWAQLRHIKADSNRIGSCGEFSGARAELLRLSRPLIGLPRYYYKCANLSILLLVLWSYSPRHLVIC